MARISENPVVILRAKHTAGNTDSSVSSPSAERVDLDCHSYKHGLDGGPGGVESLAFDPRASGVGMYRNHVGLSRLQDYSYEEDENTCPEDRLQHYIYEDPWDPDERLESSERGHELKKWNSELLAEAERLEHRWNVASGIRGDPRPLPLLGHAQTFRPGPPYPVRPLRALRNLNPALNTWDPLYHHELPMWATSSTSSSTSLYSLTSSTHSREHRPSRHHRIIFSRRHTRLRPEPVSVGDGSCYLRTQRPMSDNLKAWLRGKFMLEDSKGSMWDLKMRNRRRREPVERERGGALDSISWCAVLEAVYDEISEAEETEAMGYHEDGWVETLLEVYREVLMWYA